MNDTIRLGRLASIAVGLHWSALVGAAALTAILALTMLPTIDPDASTRWVWAAAVAGTVAFLASLLAHEFAHALVARRHQVGVIGVTLWALGGMAKLSQQAPNPRAEFQIAVAGPLMNVFGAGVFGGLFWLLRDSESWRLLAGLALGLAGINLLLAVTNLIPGSPLDGGRILAAYLWHRSGDEYRARLVAGRVGLVLGVVVIAAGLAERFVFGLDTGWWTMAVGAFIANAAKGEIGVAALRGRMHAIAMHEVMTRHPAAVPDSTTLAEYLAPKAGHTVTSASPVVRWDRQPLGFITRSVAYRTDEVERSWTTVGDAMLEPDFTPQAWLDEPVVTVLDRLDQALPAIVAVLDPSDGTLIGTVSDEQLVPLFDAPNWWGLDRPSTTPPASAPNQVGLPPTPPPTPTAEMPVGRPTNRL